MLRSIALLLGLGILVLAQPSAALACSMMPTTVKTTASFAETIVVGTFTTSEEDWATFHVDEYLKGSISAADLQIMNHSMKSIGADCSLELGPGFRFKQGDRYLMMLTPSSEADATKWKPAGGMLDAAWLITNDSISDMDDQFQPANVSLADSRTAIETVVGEKPHAPVAAAPAAAEESPSIPVVPLALGGVAILAGIAAFIGWKRQQRV